MSTLLSFSDGLVPSTLRRKMESMRPMREEIDGGGVYLPPEPAFSLQCLMLKVLFPICTLTRRVSNYVPCQRRSVKIRSESNISQEYTDAIEQ